MRALKLIKKARHLILAASTTAIVLCLALVLTNSDQQTTITQNQRQSELLLFCAGLSSVVAFELVGQSLNQRTEDKEKKKKSPLSSSLPLSSDRFQPTKTSPRNGIRWMASLLACGVGGLTVFLLLRPSVRHTAPILAVFPMTANYIPKAIPNETIKHSHILRFKPDGSIQIRSDITLSPEEIEAFHVLEGLSPEETEAIQIILEAQEKRREIQQRELIEAITNEFDPAPHPIPEN